MSRSQQGKSHDIPKRLVWDAWLKVKENGGAAGADGVTIEQFEAKLKDNLYKLWNRMSSGSYFPGPVRAVEIPKKGGTYGSSAFRTSSDRVAQTVAVMALEPNVEQVFHADSYGYRPGRSPAGCGAVYAGNGAGRRTGSLTWTLKPSSTPCLGPDFEGGRAPHGPEMDPAVCGALAESPDDEGRRNPGRTDPGTPQGGPVSPLLANLFLHYGLRLLDDPGIPGHSVRALR